MPNFYSSRSIKLPNGKNTNVFNSEMCEYIKFDDIKEFLKPTANTGSPKLPTIEEVNHAVFSSYINIGKCPSTRKVINDTYDYIVGQLRAGA